MSTSNSPLWKLQKEAKRIAHHLKRVPIAKPMTKFSIIMDDKTVVIEMATDMIKASSEPALEAMIVKYMQEAKTQ